MPVAANTEMTVLVGDLDHFKEVNDRSGHQVGDAALQRVARLLSEGKRQIDSAARVGGEEFALILPDSGQDGAFVLAERLRCALQDEFAEDSVRLRSASVWPPTPSMARLPPRCYEQPTRRCMPPRTAVATARCATAPCCVSWCNASRGARRHRRRALPRGDARPRRGRRPALQRQRQALRDRGPLRRDDGPRARPPRARSQPREARGHAARHRQGRVPDRILRKPGRLTEQELAVIRRHPELGVQILEHPSLADVRAWVGAHHERPDGLGYPLGISGDAVSLEARIVAVADAYEAMTSDRSYRDSIGHARRAPSCAAAPAASSTAGWSRPSSRRSTRERASADDRSSASVDG